MNSLAATVIVPTHDHGPTLRWSVGSALAQSIEDIEIFIIGDGATDETRDVATELQAGDSRVRFLDHPKGPRQGEPLRHQVLQNSRGKMVAYLSDDDLWLPHHLESMQQLLRDADFVSDSPHYCWPDGSLGVYVVDLGLLYYRNLLLSGENRVPLSCAAHTLAAYRALPQGWRITPAGIATDLFMWQQFLASPRCRAASGSEPTVLVFPSPQRIGWTRKARAAELEAWYARLRHPTFRNDFLRAVIDVGVREQTRLELAWSFHRDAQAQVESAKRSVESALGKILRRVRELEGEAADRSETDRLAVALRSLEIQNERLSKQVHYIENSATWKLRERVLRLPLLSAFSLRLAQWLTRHTTA